MDGGAEVWRFEGDASASDNDSHSHASISPAPGALPSDALSQSDSLYDLSSPGGTAASSAVASRRVSMAELDTVLLSGSQSRSRRASLMLPPSPREGGGAENDATARRIMVC